MTVNWASYRINRVLNAIKELLVNNRGAYVKNIINRQKMIRDAETNYRGHLA